MSFFWTLVCLSDPGKNLPKPSAGTRPCHPQVQGHAMHGSEIHCRHSSPGPLLYFPRVFVNSASLNFPDSHSVHCTLCVFASSTQVLGSCDPMQKSKHCAVPSQHQKVYDQKKSDYTFPHFLLVQSGWIPFV